MPVPPSTRSRKPATRRALLARRDALTTDERAARSAKIAEATIALLDARLATSAPAPLVVALYAPKGSEVDTAGVDAVLRARAATVAYPRVIGDALPLAFHAARAAELVPARFGLREPDPATAPAVELAAIAAFILPGLAFDRAGGRIGWGRGHYDATLAAAPAALRIGLAFEAQLVESVPREPHDVPLHAIVTEVATYAVAIG